MNISNTARIALTRAYLSAFANPANWTIEEHEEGLVRVFQAGAAAGKKVSA